MTASRVHHEVLPNGLELLLRETRLAPVAELQIWALVGSADERPGEEGLAHFHEHMLFKGTEGRGVGDVAGEIEGAGGRINAYTSFDVTVYYVTLPNDAIPTGLDVLVDAIRHSIFDEREIEREIEVVLEEIRRANDAPLHVLGDAVFAEAFQVHPYRAPILGPAESVSSFNRARVLEFFGRWYTPDNLLFVATGDFDATDLAASVRSAFADSQPAGTKRQRPHEPEQKKLREVVLRRPFERTRLDLAWHAPSFRHPDAAPLELLSFLLGECDSSRLVRRVKERDGLVDRIDSGAYLPLDPGLFSVSIDVDPERSRQAITATVSEVERVRRETVDADELERARANFLANEHFERESVSGLARKLGAFHALGGDWRSEEAYLENVRRATPQDLLRVAQSYLGTEQLTVGALLPESEGNTLDRRAIADSVAEGLEVNRNIFAPPRRAHSDAGIESYEFSNGVRLHVTPRHEVPVVAVRSALLGGLLADRGESAGLTHFLTDMWMRGTRARSAADFARSVEGLAAELEGFSGRSSLGLTLDVTSDKLEAGLDLFAEALLEPGWDLEEIERQRRETLAAIDRREDQLAQLVFLLFGETHFAGHPYRLPILGYRESVEGIDAAQLQAQQERLVRAGSCVIGVAGDVDPDRIAKALSVRLAAMPAGEAELDPTPEEAPPETIRSAELHKAREQAHLVLGFRGLTVLDPDRYALEVIAQLLAGQGGRLFLELRDRRGLAYAVNAVNVEGLAPGFFCVYIATSPEKVDDARSGILEQLERLVSEAPPPAELERAKRFLTGNFAIDQQRSANRAAHLSLDGLYGLGPDADLHYAERIDAVSSAEILRVAQAILRLDAYTLAMVRP